MSIFSEKRYPEIIIKSDNSSWVLDQLSIEIEDSLKCKFNFSRNKFYNYFNKQYLFYINKYEILKKKLNKNFIGVSFFHIDPLQEAQNKIILKKLKYCKQIKCIQVTNGLTQKYLIKKGVNKNKIFKIPIGIDIKKFPFFTLKRKEKLKKNKNLQNYLVIGSFQKDGVGWKDGNAPKKVKGPDILVKILKKLNKIVPVHVVLTGPARGYVINKLKKNHISFEHHFLKNYSDIRKYYSFLDCYIVSSRSEGGPRSILESMASGVPIFSTYVGQAPDIIKNNFNGQLYKINELDSVCRKIIKIYKNKKMFAFLTKNARKTSKKYSHNVLKKNWIKFFRQLVEKDVS